MIHTQMYMFYVGVIIGAAMGLSYDLLRLLRRLMAHNNISIFIQDIFFWIVWAFVTIDKIHIYNSGEFRIYVFVAICLGVLIYINTIGCIFKKIFSYMLCLPKKQRKKSKKMLKILQKKSKIKKNV